ncbi:MAG: zinc transporter ZupT [Rikenellaceae bacterium]|nr:zinc transporter ZupT [Rikenellaceae bacterium]
MSTAALYGLLFSLFAGLATGVGSLVALLTRTTNRKFISFALGLSAGVMLYISFVEMLADSRVGLVELFGEQQGTTYMAVAMFGGLLLAMIIDRLVPDVENPHELHSLEELSDKNNHHRLQRMGVITALAIAVHNFPEGIATFMSGYESWETGLAVALAVAIHNIPEGVAVSVPIYAATGSRRKAFWYSFASGLAEPVGALVGFALLMPIMSEVTMSVVMAAVAGIMIYISLDELLPAAREYGENHIEMYGLIVGMAVMALSLILMM